MVEVKVVEREISNKFNIQIYYSLAIIKKKISNKFIIYKKFCLFYYSFILRNFNLKFYTLMN
jgi:hypothetical protein